MSWMLLEKWNAGQFCGLNIWPPFFLELSIRLDIVTIMKPSVDGLWVWGYQVKGAVSDSSSVHFFQIQQISPHSPLAVCSVCVCWKKISVHTLVLQWRNKESGLDEAAQHYSRQSAMGDIHAYGFIKRKGVVTHEQTQACDDHLPRQYSCWMQAGPDVMAIAS